MAADVPAASTWLGNGTVRDGDDLAKSPNSPDAPGSLDS